MYASIDLVSHRLTRLLRKYKDRKLGKRKVGGGAGVVMYINGWIGGVVLNEEMNGSIGRSIDCS